MSQSDLTIQNQSFPSFRADLNDALSAINSFQSGTTRPASAVVGTIWLDTTTASTPTLKYYDGADDISLATLDHASNTVNWLDSTVAFDIINDITPQLGGMLDVNGQSIGDGTLELIKFSETASAVNEITVTNSATGTAPEISATGDDTDIDLKLTPKGAGNLILDGFEFPNTDGTAGQVLQTDGYANLSFGTVGGTNTPAFAVHASADQTLTSSTTTTMIFGTELLDTDNAFASNTFTVPTGKGGQYFLYSNIYFYGGVTNNIDRLDLAIEVNGTKVAYLINNSGANNSQDVSMHVGAICNLSAGDAVTVTVFPITTSGNGFIANSAGANRFGGFRLIQ